MLNHTALVVIIVTLCLCVSSLLLTAQDNAVQLSGAEYVAAVNLIDKNVKAEGRIFVHDKTRRVRAVIVLVNYTLFGQGLFYDQSWRGLSSACECALLYLRLGTIRPFQPNTPATADFRRSAAAGGGDALLVLLQRLGNESAHPEIADAPMLFWGWSATANFGTTFAEIYPQRTIGFIRYHTRRLGLSDQPTVLRQIPALLIAGEKDETAGVEDAMQFWRIGRAAGAPWALAVEPGATHAAEETLFTTSSTLMISWTAAVIGLRVPPDGTTLRPVTDDNAWFGNNQTSEIGSRATFRGKALEQSWLPDESTARGWRQLHQGVK